VIPIQCYKAHQVSYLEVIKLSELDVHNTFKFTFPWNLLRNWQQSFSFLEYSLKWPIRDNNKTNMSLELASYQLLNGCKAVLMWTVMAYHQSGRQPLLYFEHSAWRHWSRSAWSRQPHCVGDTCWSLYNINNAWWLSEHQTAITTQTDCIQCQQLQPAGRCYVSRDDYHPWWLAGHFLQLITTSSLNGSLMSRSCTI